MQSEQSSMAHLERLLPGSQTLPKQCTDTSNLAAYPMRQRAYRRHVTRPQMASSLNGNVSCTTQTAASVQTAAAASVVDAKLQPAINGAVPLEPQEEQVITRFVAETLLPTRHGKFRVRGYKHSIDGGLTYTEPTAIISGVCEGQEDVPIRVHDACFTSEVLGSLKCDCAEQLSLALDMIRDKPPGVVIYLQQEGRGIGLANKIAAYSLQERGLDTVDANRALGLPDDCREYTSVRNIIQELNIKSIQLITNNPRKIKELQSLGIKITGRVPCVVEETNEHNVGYLAAKRDRMDHLLQESGEESDLEGQFCYWNHDGEPTQPTLTTPENGGLGLPNNLTADKTGRVVMPDMNNKVTARSSSVSSMDTTTGSITAQ